MNWNDTLHSWRTRGHAERFRQRILDTGREAVFWETSPSRTGEEPFEERFAPSSSLAGIRADPSAFADHLVDEVNVFPNLSGRSLMIAPRPPGDFGHLAAFVRDASPALQHQVWTATADAVRDWWAGDRGRVWVSTHGTGVPWLHVRLDPRPKYYRTDLRSW